MMKKTTFTMTVIYNDEDIYANNAIDAIEHEMYNIDGIVQWDVDDEKVINKDLEIEHDDEEDYSKYLKEENE